MTSRLDYSPADVLRWLLVSLGAATDPSEPGSWPIFTGNEPDLPDDLVTTYDTAGVSSGVVQRTGEMMEYRGVSVQVRGFDYTTAWGKADEIRRVLDESVQNNIITIGDVQYIIHSVIRKSGPISIGRESSASRYLFTLNFVVSLRQLE